MEGVSPGEIMFLLFLSFRKFGGSRVGDGGIQQTRSQSLISTVLCSVVAVFVFQAGEVELPWV